MGYTSTGIHNLLERRIMLNAESQLTTSQVEFDQILKQVKSQATDPYLLASLLAGQSFVRGLDLFASPVFLSSNGILGSRIGVGTYKALRIFGEAATFEVAHRGLQVKFKGANPELLNWEGETGLRNGILHSNLTFLSMHGFGKLAGNSNLVFQHTLQSTGMVTANQIAGAFNIAPASQEPLVAQLLEAEIFNVQQQGSAALLPARLLKAFELDGMNLPLQKIKITDFSNESLSFANIRMSSPKRTPIDSSGIQEAYQKLVKRTVPNLVHTLAYLYSESFHRPLIGFDPEFNAKIDQSRALIETLQRHLSSMKESGVIPLHLRYYETSLELLSKMSDRFVTEVRKHGMTPDLAREIHGKINEVIQILRPLGESQLETIDLANPTMTPPAIHLATATADQVIGAFLGGATGDAYAAPFEGMTPEQIVAKNFDFTTLVKKGERPAGRWTDDTLFVLATADSLLETQALIPRRLANSLASLVTETKTRGIGATSKNALRNLKKGSHWKASGSEESPSNGAMMRVGPIAIFSYRNLELLKQNVILACQITHTNYEAMAGALGMAFMLAKILRGEFNPQTILHETRMFIGPGKFSGRLVEVEKKLTDTSLPPENAIQAIGTGGAVFESGVSAIYAFLYSPRDYQTTMTLLAQAGGDTDTMASIAGTLSGAYNGPGAIPVAWRRGLERGKEIEGKAQQFYTLIRP